MESIDQFSTDFRALNRVGANNGPAPLNWQTRMFRLFCADDVREVCDLPTGMGKTSIIHLWLLALRHQGLGNPFRLPMRLVYVVDRRTVVDQATEIALRIQGNLPELGLEKEWLSVSPLRGQFADNREWTTDPSRPAIIIGTVDMIGSRLLFSGYRSSYKWRPLDAGMLGQDSLLILDEAHLSGPFEELIRDLSDHGRFQSGQGRPMRVMCMSATAGSDDPTRFKLEPADLEGDKTSNPIIERYHASKRLKLRGPVDKGKIQAEIVKAAVVASHNNARVVVFVQTPDEANKIADAIGKKLKRPESVEVLTGTMRGLERDELLERPVLKRFLNGEERPTDQSDKGPAVLVSTSAGEVGFDLNADHMVCDAAPLDSMIQRLGRVNRRGYGDAEIHVFVAKVDNESKEKESPEKKSPWKSATAAAMKCLEQLARNDDGTTLDASPQALDALKAKLTSADLLDASSPKPDTVELTDILLDAWSMTSITGRMPGRPPVAPWLRGIADQEPQTTIAWRAELDLLGFDRLETEELDEWFDAHRVLPHETLSVPTRKIQEWVGKRWMHLNDGERAALGEKPCIVERAGLKVLTIKSLVSELERKRTDWIISADIILPASFGGIQRGKGLLSNEAPDSNNPLTVSADVADERGRRRLLRVDGVEANEPLVAAPPQDVSDFARFTLNLPGDGDSLTQLVSLVPKWERREYGTKLQTLEFHVGLVEKYASEIAGRLSLPDDVRQAFKLAAQWHDHGKDRSIWQNAAGRKADDKEPLGKSGGSLGRMARGYRHEFGSLREFADEYQGKLAKDTFDLAMHLIATHHGRGRPHFPKGGFDPDAPAKSAEIALDSVRRFARLQRKYGYWQLACFENLLRCADAKASADKGEQA